MSVLSSVLTCVDVCTYVQTFNVYLLNLSRYTCTYNIISKTSLFI